MLRSKRKVMKERIERERKKERDREVIMKVMVGVVLMFALIVWGGGLIAMGFPIVIGASILPKEGSTLREKWAKMSKKQKGLFALIILLMMPFIIVGLLWTVLIGSMFVIDIFVMLPIFLLLGWFILRDKKTSNPIIQFLGSNYALMIGVMLIMVIGVLAVYNYTTAMKLMENKNYDFGKNVGSLYAPSYTSGNMSVVHLPYNVTLPNGTKTNTIWINPDRTHDIHMLVVDVFTPEWLKHARNPDIYYNFKVKHQLNWTNESDVSKSISVVNGNGILVKSVAEKILVHPEEWGGVQAYVYLIGLSKYKQLGNATESLPKELAIPTDSRGRVVLHNVSEGVYKIIVKAYGYSDFIGNLTVVSGVNNRTYIVPVIPRYMHLNIHVTIDVGELINDTAREKLMGESYSSFGSGLNISLVSNAVSSEAVVNQMLNYSSAEQMFFSNIKRTQAMYGWLGVGNIETPLSGIMMTIWRNENIIYTQTIYMNPVNKQNIYAHTYHGWFNMWWGAFITKLSREIIQSIASGYGELKVHSISLVMAVKGKNTYIWSYDKSLVNASHKPYPFLEEVLHMKNYSWYTANIYAGDINQRLKEAFQNAKQGQDVKVSFDVGMYLWSEKYWDGVIHIAIFLTVSYEYTVTYKALFPKNYNYKENQVIITYLDYSGEVYTPSEWVTLQR